MPWGYRAFAVHGDGQDAFLRAANAMNKRETPLEYPHIDALCTTYAAHRAPQPDCMCGYHAYDKMGGACDYVHGGCGWIMAECWGHGRVEVCEYGWRSQRLQIVRFYFPMCESNDCRTPASIFEVERGDGQVYDRYGHSQQQVWPPPMHFRCEGHQKAAEAEAHAVEFNRQAAARVLPNEDEEGQAQMELIERTEPTVGPIDVVVAQLAERFKASVYDADATLEVYAQNLAWTKEIQEIAGRPYREKRRRQDATQLRATAQKRLGL